MQKYTLHSPDITHTQKCTPPLTTHNSHLASFKGGQLFCTNVVKWAISKFLPTEASVQIFPKPNAGISRVWCHQLIIQPELWNSWYYNCNNSINCTAVIFFNHHSDIVYGWRNWCLSLPVHSHSGSTLYTFMLANKYQEIIVCVVIAHSLCTRQSLFLYLSLTSSRTIWAGSSTDFFKNFALFSLHRGSV